MLDAETQAFIQEVASLIDDFPLYARRCLKILNKDGELEPLCLNRAQIYLHEQLETQLFEHNQVRALCLKGRQQGISTYTEGRFYHKVQFAYGKRAYILTHLAEATDNLFGMVDRYHRNVPDVLRPTTSYDSKKELKFAALDSGYKVGTAGTKGAGRSQTINYFHGSEVAFWPTAEVNVAGALQAVGKNNGSEVILESTANGVGGYFYEQWIKASKGIGDFIAVFLPWFWQPEYSAPVPKDWEPLGDELVRMQTYRLSPEQTYWMHAKNIELGGQPGQIGRLFMQEYPCNSVEAFQASGDNSLCDAGAVAAARGRRIDDPFGARVMGVDPARMGPDRTSLIDRKGRRAYNLTSYQKKTTMEVASLVAIRIDRAKNVENDPYRAVFVDIGGLGAGVVDRLNELGFDDVVIPVNAGSRALEPERFMNKRAEMWWTLSDWLKLEEGVEIPDSDSLHADLVAPTYTYNSTKQQLVLESKDQMRKRGIHSPDDGDALALTFAAPVGEPDRNRTRRSRTADWRTV